MRICLVNLRALPALAEPYKHERVGGSEVQHAQFAAALARRGHDVRLVTMDFGQPDGAVYQGVTTLKSYRESAGLPVLRFVHPRWTTLWSALARADADVYYYSCAGMILGMLAMFCGMKARGLVFRIASDADCDPAAVEIRYRRDRWLYEYGLGRSHVILAQTETQQRALAANHGLTSTVVGMLVERPGPGAAAQPKDIDVLWVANIRQAKRPDRLLALARELPHLHFHMAGALVPEEADVYRRVEAEAGAIPNLTFHGAVPYLDVGRLFDRARVFVNTSDLEGFPNTFLQSWVRGVPVVTIFDPDGVVRRNGLGSSHPDVPDMALGLRALLESDATYASARAASLTFMETHYGEDRVLGPYLDALARAHSDARTRGHR